MVNQARQVRQGPGGGGAERLQGASTTGTMIRRVRVGLIAAALVGFAIPMLTPTPAAAWWARGWRHPGWHAGWHPGWGWRPGWGYGPVIVHRVWIPPHWQGPYRVPGHWR